jgi:hypothetical protein
MSTAVHSVSAGAWRTTLSQWHPGSRTAVEAGARGQAVQHERAGILRKLDRRQVTKIRFRMPMVHLHRRTRSGERKPANDYGVLIVAAK